MIGVLVAIEYTGFLKRKVQGVISIHVTLCIPGVLEKQKNTGVNICSTEYIQGVNVAPRTLLDVGCPKK